MKIAITGGTGFVGGHFAAQLSTLGHEVVVLTRKMFSLESGAPALSLEGFDVRLKGFDLLIHAAYDFTARDDRNIAGSKRLVKEATAAGIGRIAFVSSLSAFEGCRSEYGASKLAVEQEVAAIGGCVIRLGLVYDNSGRGLSGSLKKLARLPVVPLPNRGSAALYTIQAEDLGQAFLKILDNHRGAEPVNLAHPEPVSLQRMMRFFASQQNSKPIFLPVPWRALWLPVRAAETAGINLGFRSDSLVSLMNQNPAPDFQPLGDWGIALQAFPK